MLPFLLVVILWVVRGVSACPPSESIAPLCHCSDFLRTRAMVCDRVLSPDELFGPARAAGRAVESLTIRNSSLLYVPASVFKDTGIQKVFFLSTELMSLSDGDLAFEGLEDTLSEVRASDAHYVAQWDWHQLRNLRQLQLIDVNWISMGSVDEPFPPLPNLKFLGMTRAEISFLVDGAFRALARLQVLNLKENAISEVRRNMLPDPAADLVILDLSDNDLSTLPVDFFAHMSSLSTVQLDGNKFTTLTEESFSRPMRNLRELTLSGNALRCDCRLRWMITSRRPPLFVARCHAPEALAGTPLKDLDEKLLWC